MADENRKLSKSLKCMKCVFFREIKFRLDYNILFIIYMTKKKQYRSKQLRQSTRGCGRRFRGGLDRPNCQNLRINFETENELNISVTNDSDINAVREAYVDVKIKFESTMQSLTKSCHTTTDEISKRRNKFNNNINMKFQRDLLQLWTHQFDILNITDENEIQKMIEFKLDLSGIDEVYRPNFIEISDNLKKKVIPVHQELYVDKCDQVIHNVSEFIETIETSTLNQIREKVGEFEKQILDLRSELTKYPYLTTDINSLETSRLELTKYTTLHIFKIWVEHFDDLSQTDEMKEIEGMENLANLNQLTFQGDEEAKNKFQTLQLTLKNLLNNKKTETVQRDVIFFIDSIESGFEDTNLVRSHFNQHASDIDNCIIQTKDEKKIQMKMLRAELVIRTNVCMFEFWFKHFKVLSETDEINEMMKMSDMWNDANKWFIENKEMNDGMVKLQELVLKLEPLLSEKYINEGSIRLRDASAKKFNERPKNIQKRNNDQSSRERTGKNYWGQTRRIDREGKRNDFRRDQQRKALHTDNFLQNERMKQRILQNAYNNKLPKKKTMRSRFRGWFKSSTPKKDSVQSSAQSINVKSSAQSIYNPLH